MTEHVSGPRAMAMLGKLQSVMSACLVSGLELKPQNMAQTIRLSDTVVFEIRHHYLEAPDKRRYRYLIPSVELSMNVLSDPVFFDWIVTQGKMAFVPSFDQRFGLYNEDTQTLHRVGTLEKICDSPHGGHDPEDREVMEDLLKNYIIRNMAKKLLNIPDSLFRRPEDVGYAPSPDSRVRLNPGAVARRYFWDEAK